MGRGNKKSKVKELKKARMSSLLKEEKLPILCDADSGLVYFSDGGKLYKLSSQDSLTEFSQWYHAYKNATTGTAIDSAKKSAAENMASDLQQLISRQLADKTIEEPNLQQVGELEMHLDTMLKMIKEKKKRLKIREKAMEEEEEVHGEMGEDQNDNVTMNAD